MAAVHVPHACMPPARMLQPTLCRRHAPAAGSEPHPVTAAGLAACVLLQGAEQLAVLRLAAMPRQRRSRSRRPSGAGPGIQPASH